MDTGYLIRELTGVYWGANSLELDVLDEIIDKLINQEYLRGVVNRGFPYRPELLEVTECEASITQEK